MMKRLTTPLSARQQIIVGLFALVCANFLAYLDLVLSNGFNFSYLYLLPIFLASWFVSRNMGFAVALWATAAWYTNESILDRSYAEAWIPIWNLLTRVGVFVVSAAMVAQLRAKLGELSQLAARDFLTGLPNGHAFYELAAKEMKLASDAEPLTLATIFVGGVQLVNYRFGYPAGDQMLCTIAHTIQQQAPRPDLVGRMGGTSFSVLLPNTTSENANLILQKVHEALDFQRRKFSHPLNFFFSAVACAKPPKTLAELLYQADTQMEHIKSSGKDQIQIAAVEDMPALN
jgi:diguanylate cyclase (GGDEF)-like protein